MLKQTSKAQTVCRTETKPYIWLHPIAVMERKPEDRLCFIEQRAAKLRYKPLMDIVK